MTEDKNIKNKNFLKILKMITLNRFALSFVSIFIPIFLLKLGYSFADVMKYFIVHHSVLLLGVFTAVRISNKIGLVKILHIRYFLLLSYFILLTFFLKDNPNIFYLIPIISGLESGFYWTPLNVLLVRNTKPKNMGIMLSRFFELPKFFTILSPIIGALIIAKFGFNTLFIFAMILLFFIFIPIRSLKSEKTNFIFSKDKFVEIWKRNKKFFIPEVIDNLTEDAMVLWTIYIYLTLSSTLEVGIIGTITSLASIFFTFTIGKMTDSWNKHKLLKIGAIMVSLVWFINFAVGSFMPNKYLFYIATIFASLSLKVFLVPYSSLMYNRARKDDAQFLVLREIPTVLGRIILFSIAIFFSQNLPIIFLSVGLIFLYFIFIDTKKLETDPEPEIELSKT